MRALVHRRILYRYLVANKRYLNLKAWRLARAQSTPAFVYDINKALVGLGPFLRPRLPWQPSIGYIKNYRYGFDAPLWGLKRPADLASKQTGASRLWGDGRAFGLELPQYNLGVYGKKRARPTQGLLRSKSLTSLFSSSYRLPKPGRLSYIEGLSYFSP